MQFRLLKLNCTLFYLLLDKNNCERLNFLFNVHNFEALQTVTLYTVRKCPNCGADAPCMGSLMKCKECVVVLIVLIVLVMAMGVVVRFVEVMSRSRFNLRVTQIF